jgi:hypothetical protein
MKQLLEKLIVNEGEKITNGLPIVLAQAFAATE